MKSSRNCVLTTILSAMIIPVLSLVVAQPSSAQGVFANVPEASQYQLVYQLDIAPGTLNYSLSGVPYTIDNSASISPGSFNRVAYYMELSGSTNPNDTNGFIYVSFDAAGFTNVASMLGVPTTGSGEIYQQDISNMDIVSNVPGIVTGVNLSGGNVEFWPYDYGTVNAAGVPNASDSSYDWGDTDAFGSGYGSMQIANYSASQMLFSFNAWSSDGNATSDIGIGNDPTGGNPDWTFAQNTGDYTVSEIQILAQVAVPEPGSMALLGGVILSTCLFARRRK